MLNENTPRLNRIQNRTQARQCLLKGPVDANGFADFIEDGGGLNASTSTLVANPILASIGLGYDLKGYPLNFATEVNRELAWTLNDDEENYLYLDIDNDGNVTEGVSILEPLYLPFKPSTPAAGQFYYNLYHNGAGEEFSGSVWTPVRRLFVGKVTTAVGAITKIEHDGYNIIDRTPYGVEFFTGEFYNDKPVYQYSNVVASDATSSGAIETIDSDLSPVGINNYNGNTWVMDSITASSNRSSIVYNSDTGQISSSIDGTYKVGAGTVYTLKYTKP